MRKRFLAFLLIVMLIGAGTVSAEEGKIGEPYTDFTLLGLDGNEYTLSDYEGTVIVITFWGWSCVTCKEKEMPALQTEVYARYSREQVQVFAINTDPRPTESRIEDMKDFGEERGLEYPLLYGLGEEGIRAAYDYRVFEYPTLFIIDKDGIVRLRESPESFNDHTAEVLAGIIDELDVGSEVGKKALGFSLQDMDGNTVSLSDYAGSIVVLAFFGSASINCNDMLTPLQTQIYDVYGDQVVLFGIVMDPVTDMAVLEALREDNDLTFPFLVDGLRVAVYYDFIFPGAAVIDADGIIQFRQESPLSTEFFDVLGGML